MSVPKQKLIRTTLIVKGNASKYQQQISGKFSVESTPSSERTPRLYGPLGVGLSIPIVGSLYDQTSLQRELIRLKRQLRLLWIQLLLGSLPKDYKCVITYC